MIRLSTSLCRKKSHLMRACRPPCSPSTQKKVGECANTSWHWPAPVWAHLGVANKHTQILCLFSYPLQDLQSSTHKDQSVPSLCENDSWLLFKSLLALPYSQHKNFPLIGLAKLPLHLFPFLFIFSCSFHFFSSAC